MFGGLNLNKPSATPAPTATTNPLFAGLNLSAPKAPEPEKPTTFDIFSGLGGLPPQPAAGITSYQ